MLRLLRQSVMLLRLQATRFTNSYRRADLTQKLLLPPSPTSRTVALEHTYLPTYAPHLCVPSASSRARFASESFWAGRITRSPGTRLPSANTVALHHTILSLHSSHKPECFRWVKLQIISTPRRAPTPVYHGSNASRWLIPHAFASALASAFAWRGTPSHP